MSDTLQILPKKLDVAQRNDFLNNSEAQGAHEVIRDGQRISLGPLDSLMNEMRKRVDDGMWEDRAQSDRWLAPRVHFALRLFRAEAAERGLWQWIALRYSWYVEWRWTNLEGDITDDHWWGPIHKQSFARLWWGAEIFRDGADYTPVERAFVFQDLPNSYLHRPIVRCRSLALSVVDKLSQSEAPSSDQVNDLARVLNLATVGTPPEIETHYQVDDFSAYEAWVSTHPQKVAGWDFLPEGPPAVDTTEASKEGGAQIVSRGWQYAKLG
jgi:hypothetical protein